MDLHGIPGEHLRIETDIRDCSVRVTHVPSGLTGESKAAEPMGEQSPARVLQEALDAVAAQVRERATVANSHSLTRED